MRYFDLRGFLPQPEQPATEAVPVFERIAAAHPVEGERAAGHRRPGCPDLDGQLSAAGARKVDTLILSLLDGDATLRLNAALAARFPEELLGALDQLEKRVGATRVWVVLDGTAPVNWLGPIRGAARVARRRVIPLRNDYPESDPSLLLYTLLKRKLKPGRLPTDVGAVLVDAPSALAFAHRALVGAGPETVAIAVHHADWPRARYADVEVGTPLSVVLAHYGLRAQDHTIRAGDLLRDQKVSGDYVIGGGHLTFHLHPPERAINPDPCVRCGWCLEGCPTRIHPAGLLEAAQRDSATLARHYGIESCIECGICSYVCPSHLPILQGIRRLRSGGAG